MIGKVIEISKGIVSIGIDGKIEEVRITDLNFNPKVGDEVEIFKTETKTIVSKIEKEEKSGHAPININVNQTQGSVQPTMLYQNGAVVNKWVYVLITLILGGIGGHKFYAGKVGLGVAYLLFCWTLIPAFLAFIELIIALLKPADANGNIIV